jgi:prevent-host-death family protein
MQTVNMHEAKTHLSRLVERARAGEEIVIAKSGTPVAKLVPYVENLEPRKLGGMEGYSQFWIADDFDDPLPVDVLKGFYGEDYESEEQWRDQMIRHRQRIEAQSFRGRNGAPPAPDSAPVSSPPAHRRFRSENT